MKYSKKGWTKKAMSSTKPAKQGNVHRLWPKRRTILRVNLLFIISILSLLRFCELFKNFCQFVFIALDCYILLDNWNFHIIYWKSSSLFIVKRFPINLFVITATFFQYHHVSRVFQYEDNMEELYIKKYLKFISCNVKFTLSL